MEQRCIIKEAHPKPILCAQYNPFRREYYTAGEDSSIRVWDYETRKLLNTWTRHQGWVTCLLYVKELKILLSGSIDGSIIAWSPSGLEIQRIQVHFILTVTDSPIFCMSYNSRRQLVMAGQNKKVRLFELGESGYTNTVLEKTNAISYEHSDIVSCTVSCEGRFYSVGYDRKLVIYDVTYHGEISLVPSRTIRDAHDAAISALIHGKDNDNSWY